jgi:prophage antirepressor-like protein
MEKEVGIAIFKGKKIRKIIYQNEWWFSVIDVCEALTDSVDAGAYWRKLKQRLIEEGSEVVTFCHGLKLDAPDGKKYETDCADTEGIFRIIQSVPSPKAEPFKRWLELEKELGRSVVSKQNYLPKKTKKLLKKKK